MDETPQQNPPLVQSPNQPPVVAAPPAANRRSKFIVLGVCIVALLLLIPIGVYLFFMKGTTYVKESMTFQNHLV